LSGRQFLKKGSSVASLDFIPCAVSGKSLSRGLFINNGGHLVSGRHFGSLLTAVVSNRRISQTLSLIIIIVFIVLVLTLY